MTGCHNKSNDQVHSPLKTMLGKLRDKYQSYCTTYKTHAMTTHQEGTGHTGKDRDLGFHVEDTRGIAIGPNNNNESTSSSDSTLAFGVLEADGCLGDLLPSSQANLAILRREINSLQQYVEAQEGQPVDRLDHIEWELQNLFLTLRAQPTSIPDIHRHTIHHTEANKSHKLTVAGHCHFLRNIIQQN